MLKNPLDVTSDITLFMLHSFWHAATIHGCMFHLNFTLSYPCKNNLPLKQETRQSYYMFVLRRQSMDIVSVVLRTQSIYNAIMSVGSNTRMFMCHK